MSKMGNFLIEVEEYAAQCLSENKDIDKAEAAFNQRYNGNSMAWQVFDRIAGFHNLEHEFYGEQ